MQPVAGIKPFKKAPVYHLKHLFTKKLDMKKITLFLALTVFTAAGLYAQDSTAVKHHQHGKRGGHDLAMYQSLQLTQEQNDKIKAFNDDTKAKRKEIMNNSSLTQDDKKKQLKELKANNQKNIAGVLTDEQKAKLKEMRKQRKMHSPKNSGGSPNESSQANG